MGNRTLGLVFSVAAAVLVSAAATAAFLAREPRLESGDETTDPVASASRVPPPSRKATWRNRIPDVTLTTHDGKKVRFYEDLVRGKIVVINFMYVTCTGT